jgi:hypothetical protein
VNVAVVQHTRNVTFFPIVFSRQNSRDGSCLDFRKSNQLLGMSKNTSESRDHGGSRALTSISTIQNQVDQHAP